MRLFLRTKQYPVLLRKTKYYSSTSLYYKVPLQYYKVLLRHMKMTVSAHVYNTFERYPQVLKMRNVEKAMGNLKCWMALRVNRGFESCSYG